MHTICSNYFTLEISYAPCCTYSRAFNAATAVFSSISHDMSQVLTWPLPSHMPIDLTGTPPRPPGLWGLPFIKGTNMGRQSISSHLEGVDPSKVLNTKNLPDGWRTLISHLAVTRNRLVPDRYQLALRGPNSVAEGSNAQLSTCHALDIQLIASAFTIAFLTKES